MNHTVGAERSSTGRFVPTGWLQQAAELAHIRFFSVHHGWRETIFPKDKNKVSREGQNVPLETDP